MLQQLLFPSSGAAVSRACVAVFSPRCGPEGLGDELQGEHPPRYKLTPVVTQEPFVDLLNRLLYLITGLNIHSLAQEEQSGSDGRESL